MLLEDAEAEEAAAAAAAAVFLLSLDFVDMLGRVSIYAAFCT